MLRLGLRIIPMKALFDHISHSHFLRKTFFTESSFNSLPQFLKFCAFISSKSNNFFYWHLDWLWLWISMLLLILLLFFGMHYYHFHLEVFLGFFFWGGNLVVAGVVWVGS